jgi:hypothetical protein
VARFFKDASFGVQLALDGGLRWGTGATPNAVAYYSGDDSKFHVKPIYAGNPPTDGAELKLASSAAELTKDLDLGSNKLKWGANAELAYNGGTVELNSADLDLDSGKKLKWGNQAEIVSGASGSLEVNGADIDLDAGKKLRWASFACLKYQSEGQTLFIGRGEAELQLFGTIVAATSQVQLGSYLYLDGSAHNCWLRYVSGDSALKIELGGAEMWLGGGVSPDWLKLKYAESRYYASQLNLDARSDAPTSAASKGNIRLRQWYDGGPRCTMYLCDGTSWFYASFSSV